MTDPRNQAFAADLRGWHSQTRAAHLHIWSCKSPAARCRWGLLSMNSLVCQHDNIVPTDAVNFGAYLQPFPNYPRVLGENIRWFAANGVTGVYMVTMPDVFSSLCARCCSHGFSTSECL